MPNDPVIQVDLSFSQLCALLDAVRFYHEKGVDEFVDRRIEVPAELSEKIKQPYRDIFRELENYILSQRRRILDQ